MKRFFFLITLFSSVLGWGCEAHTKTASGFPLKMIQKNHLIFFTDPERCLTDVEGGDHLLEMARRLKTARGKPFDVVIDSFCGDGQSGLSLLSENIAEKLIGQDVDSKALEFASLNAQMNHLGKKATFSHRLEKIPLTEGSGNRLWMANLGENGGDATLHFVREALQAATPGDVILGIDLSRIDSQGVVELEEKLNLLTSELGGKLVMTLLEGKKIWRGFNGKKEQDNPMKISGETFALKANPYHPEEIAEYRALAKSFLDSGFKELAAFSYVINK